MNTNINRHTMNGLNAMTVMAEKNTILFDILTNEYNPKKFKQYNVLEIGCGLGHFARQMSFFFKKYDAIDISPEIINSARKQTHQIYLNLTFFVANILDAPMSNQRYKIIFASNAIHMIGNFEVLFANIYQRLKKNGICIIVENKPEPARWADQSLNILSDNFDEKRWLYKKKQLDDTHKYIETYCNYQYIDGQYNRFYVIRNITPIIDDSVDSTR